MKVETIESEEKTVTGREGEAAFMSLTNFLYGFSVYSNFRILSKRSP
jgi:hypothetical protein